MLTGVHTGVLTGMLAGVEIFLDEKIFPDFRDYERLTQQLTQQFPRARIYFFNNCFDL